MKKILAFTLAILLVLFTSACGKSNILPSGTPNNTQNPGNSETPNNADTLNKTETFANCEITVLSCAFDKEVTAQDEEFIGSSFSERQGKVFVDLVLKVKNTGNTNITKDDITAYFMYNDLRYDMQFEIETNSTTAFVSGDDGILPQTTATIHLFDLVEEAAINENLTVHYTVGEKNFDIAVAKEDTRNALAKKTQVSVGQKIDNGDFSFEVIECSTKQYLQANNLEESQQYQPFGKGQFFHLLLKVKNNTAQPLKSITSYTIVNDTIIRGNSEKEINNNTELEDLDYQPLASGEEEYCHLYAVIDEGITTSGLILRFNLGGICYYCELK